MECAAGIRCQFPWNDKILDYEIEILMKIDDGKQRSMEQLETIRFSITRLKSDR